MKCPNCKMLAIKPWPWMDGGYKGVVCDNCNAKFWSDKFAELACAEETNAVKKLIDTTEFPDDAVTDEEFRADIGTLLQKDKNE